MKKYIITILGKDQPGIIAAVSRVLFEQDFNIEDVRQTILQSEFSGIFIILGPDNVDCSQLRDDILAATDMLNLDCHVKTLAPTPDQWTEDTVESFVISTRGPDCKGLVAQIAAVLAEHHINVTQLHAVFRGGSAPEDNVMVYEVDIPITVDLNNLRQELRSKAEQLNLEISFQHKSIFESINRI
jgi:glycine cleavage system transcriptional repressor